MAASDESDFDFSTGVMLFFFNIITSTIFINFLRNYVSICSKIVMALKGQMHIKVSD